MAVTGSTMVAVVDEKKPCWHKLCGCNGFQWDFISVDKPVGLHKHIFP